MEDNYDDQPWSYESLQVYGDRPYNDPDHGVGIPIKLELASRFMAAMIAHPDPAWASVTYPEMAHQALKASDALITEFNNQQKEGK